mmetsp:Transcript_1079/g.4546  ORF Transcript_1079/g.4546 Transcript_1079/m.4546 type:complete len:266 (-) Transcript_1079:581-1378(-)
MIPNAASRSFVLSWWYAKSVNACASVASGFVSVSELPGNAFFSRSDVAVSVKTFPIEEVLPSSEYRPAISRNRDGTPFRRGLVMYARRASSKSAPCRKSSGARAQNSAPGCFSANSAYRRFNPVASLSRSRLFTKSACHSWLSGMRSTKRRNTLAAFERCAAGETSSPETTSLVVVFDSANRRCKVPTCAIHPARSTIFPAFVCRDASASSTRPASSNIFALNMYVSESSNLAVFGSSPCAAATVSATVSSYRFIVSKAFKWSPA